MFPMTSLPASATSFVYSQLGPNYALLGSQVARVYAGKRVPGKLPWSTPACKPSTCKLLLSWHTKIQKTTLFRYPHTMFVFYHIQKLDCLHMATVLHASCCLINAILVACGRKLPSGRGDIWSTHQNMPTSLLAADQAI